MIALHGERLKNYAGGKAKEYFSKRTCFKELNDFCQNGSDGKVLALYGLRRTGKSTLMCQEILELGCSDDILWLQAEYGDSMRDIRSEIDAHPAAHWIFLDEATKAENFIRTASVLSDLYAAEGRKIVLTGTDSLGIHLAGGRELFDRMHKIHTTYIPYKEFSTLFPQKTLDEYIEFGGTLTDGTLLYNKDTIDEYTNDSIAGNMQHGLEGIGRDGEFGLMTELYDNDEFIPFINKIVELHNRTFLMRTIRRSFKSHDIGSLKDFIQKGKMQISDDRPLGEQEFLDAVRDALHIKDTFRTKITKEMMNEAKNYLTQMDVILNVPNTGEVIFTQPGLRYAQVEKETDLLLAHPLMTKHYTRAGLEELANKLMQDVKGRMLEDIIYYQLCKDKDVMKKYSVRKYSLANEKNTHEFDIVLESKTNNRAIVMEVKHSARRTKEQLVHLENKAFCQGFEHETRQKIVGKCVVYMGETTSKDGILYQNAEKFLKKPRGAFDHTMRVFEAYQNNGSESL